MKVVIVATKGCNHRRILERYLQAMDIVYTVQYFDESPELIEKYGGGHALNLVVDGKVEFCSTPTKCLPTQAELQKIFHK